MMNSFKALIDIREGTLYASPLLLFLLDLNQGPSD